MTFWKHPSLLLLSALLCLMLGQMLFFLHTTIKDQMLVRVGLGLILLGGVLAINVFRHESPADELSAGGWQPGPRTQLWCVLGLTLFAALLRMIWLDRLPYKVDGDAAAFAMAAKGFLKPSHPPLIGTGWQSHTNLYFSLVSLMLRLFGTTAVGIRALSALGGTLGVLAVFALGRALWGFRVGLFAALALAVQPFDLVFSRVGTEVVHLTWLLPLVTLSIWQGWRRDSWAWLLLGGMLTGLSQYFYPGARLIPLLALGQLGLLTLWPSDRPRAGWRDLRRGLWALSPLIVGALIVYGPMIPHFLRHPDIYTARLTLVSIISTGWLEQQLAQQPWWRVLGGQLWRAYLPFHYPVKGPALWFKWPQYLSPTDAALLTLGLLGVWFGRRSPIWLKLYIAGYLLGGIVLAGVMTIDTPMPSRYMVFMPGVALLIGYALERVLAHWLALVQLTDLRVVGRAERGLALAVVGASLCLYSGWSVRSYLQHDTQAIDQDDETSQQATYAARYLLAQPDQQYDIFFLKTKYFYFQASPVLAFLTGKTGENIEEPLDCAVLAQHFSPQRRALIAPPERIEELRQIEPRISGASLMIPRNTAGREVVGVLLLPPPPTGSSYPCTPTAMDNAEEHAGQFAGAYQAR